MSLTDTLASVPVSHLLVRLETVDYLRRKAGRAVTAEELGSYRLHFDELQRRPHVTPSVTAYYQTLYDELLAERAAALRGL